MTLFDLILLLVLFGFTWFGLWHGLIKTISGIVGFVLSVIIASQWYEPVALRLLPLLEDNFTLARILGFLLVFVIAQGIIFFILRGLNRVFDFSILKVFNRLAGGLFGLLQGSLVVGFILYFSSKLPLGHAWSNLLEGSFLAGTLIAFCAFLLPFLPRAIKEIQSLIK